MANDSQIAIRLPEEDLKALDAAIASGRYENRATALRQGLRGLLRREYEDDIARAYERAYAVHPQEDSIGEAGAILMTENVRQLESDS